MSQFTFLDFFTLVSWLAFGYLALAFYTQGVQSKSNLVLLMGQAGLALFVVVTILVSVSSTLRTTLGDANSLLVTGALWDLVEGHPFAVVMNLTFAGMSVVLSVSGFWRAIKRYTSDEQLERFDAYVALWVLMFVPVFESIDVLASYLA